MFIRTDRLREVGGWDPDCLAEDCEIGVRLSSRGAKVAVAYDPDLVTREETPGSVRELCKQRTRWNQGFLQVLRKGEWRRLPTTRQRLLARYTLAMPFLQAFTGVLIPVSLATMILLDLPVLAALITFVPLVATLATLAVEAAGLGEFCRSYGHRARLLDYLRLLVGTSPTTCCWGRQRCGRCCGSGAGSGAGRRPPMSAPTAPPARPAGGHRDHRPGRPRGDTRDGAASHGRDTPNRRRRGRASTVGPPAGAVGADLGPPGQYRPAAGPAGSGGGRAWHRHGPAPQRVDDEGTYVAQAWVVQHWRTLGHYTYWYDHPPLGWLLLAAWTSLTGAFGRATTAIAAGREFMLAVQLLSAALLYGVARRLELRRVAAAGAVLVFSLSPLALGMHRAVYLDNIAIPFVVAAFLLVLSPTHRLAAHAAGGLCLAAAVLVRKPACCWSQP